MDLERFTNQLFFLTALIKVRDPVSGAEYLGTGFFCSVTVNPTDSLILLVSNRHVLANPKHTLTLKFTKKREDAYAPDFGKIVDLSGDFHEIYYSHPDADVELACINVSIRFNDHNIWHKHFTLYNWDDFVC